MNTLTLGIATGDKFRIRIGYYVGDLLYTDEFQSPLAIAQGERIAITYNPFNPQENSRTHGNSMTGRLPLVGVGIAGSVVLTILWLAVMRGCS